MSGPSTLTVVDQCIILNSLSSSSISSSSSCDILVEGPPPPFLAPPYLDRPSPRPSWEKFDEVDGAPPLPPPRSELEEFSNVRVKTPSETKVEFVVVEGSSPNLSPQPSPNPFEPVESSPRSKSPLDDSSISIALRGSLENLTKDSEAASAFAKTGKEKWETFEGSNSSLTILDSEVKVSESVATDVLPPVPTTSTTTSTPSVGTLPLNNTAPSLHRSPTTQTNSPSVLLSPVSSGATTTETHTLQARTNLFNSPHSSPHLSHSRTSTLSRSHYAVSSSILRPIPQEGVVSADFITNPFYSGSINAGDYPALIKLQNKPAGPRSPKYVQTLPLSGSPAACTAPKLQPKSQPPKPMPYSGEYSHVQSMASRNQNTNNAAPSRRDSVIPFMVQRLPSLGVFDPFGDLLDSEDEQSVSVDNPSDMTVL